MSSIRPLLSLYGKIFETNDLAITTQFVETLQHASEEVLKNLKEHLQEENRLIDMHLITAIHTSMLWPTEIAQVLLQMPSQTIARIDFLVQERIFDPAIGTELKNILLPKY